MSTPWQASVCSAAPQCTSRHSSLRRRGFWSKFWMQCYIDAHICLAIWFDQRYVDLNCNAQAFLQIQLSSYGRPNRILGDKIWSHVRGVISAWIHFRICHHERNHKGKIYKGYILWHPIESIWLKINWWWPLHSRFRSTSGKKYLM